MEHTQILAGEVIFLKKINRTQTLALNSRLVISNPYYIMGHVSAFLLSGEEHVFKLNEPYDISILVAFPVHTWQESPVEGIELFIGVGEVLGSFTIKEIINTYD
jgi:hypothetical protein